MPLEFYVLIFGIVLMFVSYGCAYMMYRIIQMRKQINHIERTISELTRK
jgi:cell division protein FtsL